MANVCANFMKPLSCFQMVNGINGQKAGFRVWGFGIEGLGFRIQVEGMNLASPAHKAPQFCSFNFGEVCRTLHSQAIAGICNSLCILIVPLYWLEMVRRSHNWQPQSRRQIMGFLVSGYRPAVEPRWLFEKFQSLDPQP